MRKNKNCGFTIMELLVVVAIIAVLVAISIPIFSTQLEHSREIADYSNLRSAYSEGLTDSFDADTPVTSFTVNGVKINSSGTFDYTDGVDLPFDLPNDLTVSKGIYNVTFDLTGSRPSATLTAADS